MKRTRRAWLFGGAAAVAVVVAVLFWVTGGQGAGPAAEVAEPQAETRPAVAREASSTYQPQRRPIEAVSAVAVEDRAAGAGVLEGIVLSFETNEPVSGAELTFARGERVSSTMSNLAGGFEFRAAEPGTYELATVTAEGFLPFAPEWGHSPIRLEAREGLRIRDIIIHLQPAIDYEGRVVDPRGAPIAGAEVTILSARQGQTALAPLAERFTSDEAGLFHFQAPMGALLEARREGFVPGRARLTERARLQQQLTIELRPGDDAEGADRTIAGRVLDGAGRPLEGALVEARAAGRPRRFPPTSSQALTDETGAFLLEGLDEGIYFVSASADGWTPARVPLVPTGTEGVELRLGEGGAIQGVVTEARTGQPVPGFSVILEAVLGGLRRAPYRTEVFFDAEGRFEVRGLEARSYEVSVSSHGFARSEATRVTLSRAGEQATADFALSRGGTASGTVLDEDSGQPVVDAQISLEAAGGGGDTPVPVTARTVTDSLGRFELFGLAPGRRSLAVRAQGYNYRLITGLEVSEDGAIGPLTVELSATGEGEDPALELTGIGAILMPRQTSLVVMRVLEDGGAAEVGLTEGDAILWVDGQPVTDLGFSGSVERIRGPEGTAVRLTVRKTDGTEVEVTVPRRRVRG